MFQPSWRRTGVAAALIALGALALSACEAPLPIAPVPSPEASPSQDPLGPPSL